MGGARDIEAGIAGMLGIEKLPASFDLTRTTPNGSQCTSPLGKCREQDRKKIK